MKLLSPVGNFESLKLALSYGADEVYLGINDFNARNNISGFTIDDIDEVVFLAHINNVKVNLAVNILFKDDELEQAVNLIVKAYNKGVDCFIIQDLGLAYILHANYPEIEIHASTQMGIHNLDGAKVIERLGFKRVVLARETPLDEIKSIKENTSLEIEYFVHGALCVSFSGNCFLSSYLCNASGNRGKCKQLCRLPYTLQEGGRKLASGYLLSAKDFNMIDRLPELKEAGVNVLKIEGRARRPFYIAAITLEYAKVLKGEQANQDLLKLAFNREYTQGYFNGNDGIISKYNNHIGIKIGEVLKVNKGKKFNEITFTSSRPLTKKSSIKIFDKDREISTISLYDLKQIDKYTYITTTTQMACAKNTVNLISDYELEEQLTSYSKKVDLYVDVIAMADNKIIAKTNFLNRNFVFEGNELEKGNNQILTLEEMKKSFNKNDYFNVEISLQTDGVFVPKSVLNQFRREFFIALRNYILKSIEHHLEYYTFESKPKEIKIFNDFQFIDNINEALKQKNIIYSPETYEESEIIKVQNLCFKVGKKMYLDLPNFALNKDVEFLKKIIERNNIPVVVNNYYALNFNCEKIIGGGLDVFNKVSASVLNAPIICSEDTFIKKTKFAYMTLRHCPFKCNIKANCSNCPYKPNRFSLKTQSGHVLNIKRKKLSTCTFYLTD